MRDVLKLRRRRWCGGWLLPLVLLALPNCMLQSGGLPGNEPVFEPGDAPLSSAIMCDIPKVPTGSDCADATQTGSGMPREYAAIALAQGEMNSLALDFSPAATNACNGLPKKTEFFGSFPDGSTVCLNCGQQIPAKYADANAACVAQCVDLVKHVGDVEPPEGAQKFCETNAHVSTNFDKHSCYAGACSNGGSPNSGFVDPRRAQELVTWTDLLGQATSQDNDVSKLTGTGVPGDPFDSGAASDQRIKHGDAWVEFSVKETGVSHVIGLSHDNGGMDSDPSLADIGFAISLNYDGNVYILENGASYVSAPLMTYAPGDRFRIRVKDNNDGSTATISYTKLNGVCKPGTICNETTIATQTSASPAYPLRIGASFREPGATITNVTMVRIQDLP
jgi:hypothetical protein